MVVLYALIAWLVFMVTALLNGAFREMVIMPSLSEAAAHVTSTLILCAALALEISVFFSIVGEQGAGVLLALGVLWAALTAGFEFGFGHYVARQPWPALLENYNVCRGRVWVLVLAVLLIAPTFLGG